MTVAYAWDCRGMCVIPRMKFFKEGGGGGGGGMLNPGKMHFFSKK